MTEATNTNAIQPETTPASWPNAARREWGATAEWIHGDGRYAVLHPCSDELTVTLCATPADAKAMKSLRCGGGCTPSRHRIIDLGRLEPSVDRPQPL
jgi:hypothetical protein